MNAELHEFHPEEVMAYLDGEITGERALALADHLQQCAECSALADDFCALSQQIISWKTEPSPLVESPANLGVEALTAEEAMGAFKFDKESIAALLPAPESAPAVGGRSSLLSSILDFIWRPRVQRPWVWAFASACAVLLIVSSLSLRRGKYSPGQSVLSSASRETKTQNAKRDSSPTLGTAPNSGLSLGGARARSNSVSVDGADATDNSVNAIRGRASPEDKAAFRRTDNLPINGRSYFDFSKSTTQTSRDVAPSIGAAPDTSVHSELATKASTDEVDTAVVPAQMIERTASLSVTVKEMDAARAARGARSRPPCACLPGSLMPLSLSCESLATSTKRNRAVKKSPSSMWTCRRACTTHAIPRSA